MDLAPYIEGWKRRKVEEKARIAKKRRRILDTLRRIAPSLAKEFRLRRVWLFGSWAWGMPHRRSDVDVAAEGLASGRWSEVFGRLEDTFPGESVDLVQIERLPDWVQEKIRKQGVLLHDST